MCFQFHFMPHAIEISQPYLFIAIRDGTTDITRTVHWGTPTAMQRVTPALIFASFVCQSKINGQSVTDELSVSLSSIKSNDPYWHYYISVEHLSTVFAVKPFKYTFNATMCETFPTISLLFTICLVSQEAFTRVLMGNIEISRTIFPSGTRGGNENIHAHLKWDYNKSSLQLFLVSPLGSSLPPQ